MKLIVDLGKRSYPITIQAGLLQQAETFTSLAGRKLCVVTNTSLKDYYLEPLLAALPQAPETVVILSDGEQYKTLSSVETIFDHALKARLNRSSVMIALGGGVIGDMTGFAAACYQRGIDFVQVPTTLLSQVDSSVGGKTGVNHPLGKNMIGAFHQPIQVVIDTNTLKTLPPREYAAGMAEVIKYGLIADAEFFAWLEENIEALNVHDEQAISYAIHRSCAIKADVVAKDETEGGIRAILNLGHTFGHAIEAEQGYGAWLHGEAVAAGMIMAVDLSCRLGWLDASVLERSIALVQRANLPVKAPNSMTVDGFLQAMALDKKNIHGKLRLVLLTALGEAIITEDADIDLIRDVITDAIAV